MHIRECKQTNSGLHQKDASDDNIKFRIRQNMNMFNDREQKGAVQVQPEHHHERVGHVRYADYVDAADRRTVRRELGDKAEPAVRYGKGREARDGEGVIEARAAVQVGCAELVAREQPHREEDQGGDDEEQPNVEVNR